MKKIKESYYKVSEWIQLRTDLDLFEKNILAIVTTFGSTRLTNPQLEVILSVEEKTISRKIKSLVEKGLIEVKRKQSGKRILVSIPTLSLPNTDIQSVNTDFKSTPSGINLYTEKEIEKISDGALDHIEKTQPEKTPLVQAVSDSAGEKYLRYSKMEEDGAVFSRVYKLLSEEEKEYFFTLNKEEKQEYINLKK